MVALRTCTGCFYSNLQCEARDAFKQAVKGLGITSAKWRCKSRRDAFDPGDPVWARTMAFQPDGEERMVVDDFPATLIRLLGSKALVFIAPGSVSRGKYEFETTGNGFCKIPLSRIFERDGPKDTICRSCERPSAHGHMQGYMCTVDPALSALTEEQ